MTAPVHGSEAFLRARREARDEAGRLRLKCYVANGQLVELCGDLSPDGTWPPAPPPGKIHTIARPASEAEKAMWELLLKIAPSCVAYAIGGSE